MGSRLQLLSKNGKHPLLKGSTSASILWLEHPLLVTLGPTPLHTQARSCLIPPREEEFRGVLDLYLPTAPSDPFSSWSLDQLTSISSFLPSLCPPLSHCTKASWATVHCPGSRPWWRQFLPKLVCALRHVTCTSSSNYL